MAKTPVLQTHPDSDRLPPGVRPAAGGSYQYDPDTDVYTRIEAPTEAPDTVSADPVSPVPGVIGTRPDDSSPGIQIDGQGLRPAADTPEG